MRILLHDYSGHAFLLQLAHQLAQRDHEVCYCWSDDITAPHGQLNEQHVSHDKITLKGLSTGAKLEKYRLVSRMLQERRYAAALKEWAGKWGPDVVLLANTPIDVAEGLGSKLKSMNVPWVFWVQDIYSLAIERLLSSRSLPLRTVASKVYKFREKRLMEEADHLILISDDFKNLIKEWGVYTEGRASVIPNWAALDQIPPRPKDNPWAQRHGLHDQFCFLYAGTLGLKHNPSMLIDLAKHFQDTRPAQIVVVSEGPGADYLKARKEELALNNLHLFPFQPMNALPDVLGTGDVLVSMLIAEASVLSVPSKVLSNMAARRSQLCAIPKENLSARLIVNNNAGLVVEPADTTAWIDAATQLYANPDERHRLANNGRQYAERAFDIQKIGQTIERLLQTLTAN